MSKRETPLIRAYWQEIGGTLVEEFLAVPLSDSHGYRRLDAIILPNLETHIGKQKDVSLDGEDVIIVQAKASRLGMYLMGQALFSLALVRQRFRPASVRSIALCTEDDSILRPLLEEYEDVHVVVMSKIEQDASPSSGV